MYNIKYKTFFILVKNYMLHVVTVFFSPSLIGDNASDRWGKYKHQFYIFISY